MIDEQRMKDIIRNLQFACGELNVVKNKIVLDIIKHSDTLNTTRGKNLIRIINLEIEKIARSVDILDGIN